MWWGLTLHGLHRQNQHLENVQGASVHLYKIHAVDDVELLNLSGSTGIVSS